MTRPHSSLPRTRKIDAPAATATAATIQPSWAPSIPLTLEPGALAQVPSAPTASKNAAIHAAPSNSSRRPISLPLWPPVAPSGRLGELALDPQPDRAIPFGGLRRPVETRRGGTDRSVTGRSAGATLAPDAFLRAAACAPPSEPRARSRTLAPAGPAARRRRRRSSEPAPLPAAPTSPSRR